MPVSPGQFLVGQGKNFVSEILEENCHNTAICADILKDKTTCLKL
jgi:hypothetical protein